MALETLKDVKEIGGFEAAHVELLATEEDLRKYVIVNHGMNFIGFWLQKGPIKEVGITGCQVETLIDAAKLIIEGFNKKYPCIENVTAILKLDSALDALAARKKNREARGVEGQDKL